MIVLTQTALKRLLIHTSINLKTLSDNETSSCSSSSSSSGQNSAQNSLNLVNLSQKNYILELQKEKVFTSLGILILNFSQVLAKMKNGKEKGNKRRKRHSQNGSRNENRDEDEDGDGGTEDERKEGKDDEENENGEEEVEGEGEGEGEDNDDNEDPCDLLSTVDLIISILTHVVSYEVRSRSQFDFSPFLRLRALL